METKRLSDLILDLEKELLRLGYSTGSIRFYKRRWQELMQFASDHNESYYSEKLGLSFLEEHFNILEKDIYDKLSQSDVQNIRVIRMLGDFQLHGTILRRYYKHKQILNNIYFFDIIVQFKDFCIGREYSTVTIEHYTKQSSKFLDYIDSQSISSLNDIKLVHINNYIRTLSGYTYKTVEQHICSLRVFFKFLYQKNLNEADYSTKLPMVQARKQTRIPSVWTHNELKRLMAAIDLGNPTGKRDYAIILLACRLGLRCKDIKELQFENFHWENKQLIFIQSKTSTQLSLPLTDDVGWAVIDYIKYGRPKVENCKYVFIRHLAPFLPFSKSDHLNQIISKYMRIAHIPKTKKKRGMHSLRHTLASVLLENNTPLPIISDILGHLDTDSTSVYLKVDINKLNECPLELDGDVNE